MLDQLIADEDIHRQISSVEDFMNSNRIYSVEKIKDLNNEFPTGDDMKLVNFISSKQEAENILYNIFKNYYLPLSEIIPEEFDILKQNPLTEKKSVQKPEDFLEEIKGSIPDGNLINHFNTNNSLNVKKSSSTIKEILDDIKNKKNILEVDFKILYSNAISVTIDIISLRDERSVESSNTESIFYKKDEKITEPDRKKIDEEFKEEKTLETFNTELVAEKQIIDDHSSKQEVEKETEIEEKEINEEPKAELSVEKLKEEKTEVIEKEINDSISKQKDAKAAELKKEKVSETEPCIKEIKENSIETITTELLIEKPIVDVFSSSQADKTANKSTDKELDEEFKTKSYIETPKEEQALTADLKIDNNSKHEKLSPKEFDEVPKAEPLLTVLKQGNSIRTLTAEFISEKLIVSDSISSKLPLETSVEIQGNNKNDLAHDTKAARLDSSNRISQNQPEIEDQISSKRKLNEKSREDKKTILDPSSKIKHSVQDSPFPTDFIPVEQSIQIKDKAPSEKFEHLSIASQNDSSIFELRQTSFIQDKTMLSTSNDFTLLQNPDSFFSKIPEVDSSSDEFELI